MVKSRSAEPKADTVRKTIRKKRNLQQKISVPFIFNCDGDVNMLVPLFLKVVELLSKKSSKTVRRKLNVGRGRKKAKKATPCPRNTQEKSSQESLSDIIELPPVASKKSLVRRGQSRKAASNKARNALPAQLRRKRDQGLKCSHLAPPPRRQCLIPSKYLNPTSKIPDVLVPAPAPVPASASAFASALPPAPASVPASAPVSVPAPVPASVPAPAPPLASASSAVVALPLQTRQSQLQVEAPTGIETSSGDSSSSLVDETMARLDSRVMMFMAAQRAALEAFSTVGNRLHTAERLAANQISYNFLDAWNAAIQRRDSALNLLCRPQIGSCPTISRLGLLASPVAIGQEGRPTVLNTIVDGTIYAHIRNSLDDICTSISSHPKVSSSSSASDIIDDLTVDIYNHIRTNLGDNSSENKLNNVEGPK